MQHLQQPEKDEAEAWCERARTTLRVVLPHQLRPESAEGIVQCARLVAEKYYGHFSYLRLCTVLAKMGLLVVSDDPFAHEASVGLHYYRFALGYPEDTAKGVISALQHDDACLRAEAAGMALMVHPDYKPIVVPALVEALKDSDPVVRAMAARTLGDFGSNKVAAVRKAVKSAVSDLTKATADSNEEVRHAATEALRVIPKWWEFWK